MAEARVWRPEDLEGPGPGGGKGRSQRQGTHTSGGRSHTAVCENQHSSVKRLSRLKIKVEKEERYNLAFKELTVWQRGTH